MKSNDVNIKMTKEPFIAHSEITDEIYIVCGREKYSVTEQVIKAMQDTGRLKQSPTDVIERSKINRVIEELCEKVKNRGFLSCESDYIQREIRSIFKRNIGE